jgi:hypothetical protein
MQDKEEERALSNVEAKLTSDGFTEDFRVADGRLIAFSDDKRTYGPEDVTIVDFYRFEGESNPDDMAILYVIETNDGLKGTISAPFGVYSDDAIDEFMQTVEDLGKNLKKAHK